jgi:hypothetical protein
VTVRLQGGFEPWRAIHARAWEPGQDEAPAFYFVPDMERVEQFKYATEWTPAQREEYDRTMTETPQPFVQSNKVQWRGKVEVKDGVASEKDTH